MKSRIDLFNTSFFLHSDEDNEYIQSLVGYIKSKVETVIEDINTNDDHLKTAILSLLLITHELQDLKKELKDTNTYTVSSINQLINVLQETTPAPHYFAN